MIATKKTIAAFDFDKTLIDRDSLLPFLFFTHSYFETCWKLFLLLSVFILYVLGLKSRQTTKEAILMSFYQGRLMNELLPIGKLYADNRLDRYIVPEALNSLKWHLKQGHSCVLVSASVNLYLEAWAVRHGFSEVISSLLQVDREGRITGKLEGLNCWGEEKKRRFLERFDDSSNYTLYYYGDSEGDKAMLDLADYPFYRKFE